MKKLSLFCFLLFSQILFFKNLIAQELTPEIESSFESRISSLEEQIRHLNGKIEEAEHALSANSAKLDNIKQDIDFKIDELKQTNNNKIQADQKNTQTTEPKVVKQYTEKEINEQYELAFSLVRDGDYTKAEQALKNFIKNFESNPLSGNAYYWLGETYLALDSKDSAALNFLYSYKKFPKGNKAPDALFKLSTTLAKIGKRKEACESLNRLLTSYPKLHAALKTGANSELKQLACNAKEKISK